MANKNNVRTVSVQGIKFEAAYTAFHQYGVEAVEVSLKKILEIGEDTDTIAFGKPDGELMAIQSIRVSMLDEERVFPQVKKFVLGKDVDAVHVNNRTFPNVERVECLGDGLGNFMDGSCLVHNANSTAYIHGSRLLNTFCSHEGGTVDLSGVETIDEAGAFAGCKASHIINTKCLKKCSMEVFESTEFANPGPGGVRVEGDGLVTAIDCYAKELDFPADVAFVPSNERQELFGDYVFMRAEKLTIRSMQALIAVEKSGYIALYAKEVEISIGRDGNPRRAIKALREIAPKAECVSLIEENAHAECMDGMLFSKDKKTLLYCPPVRSGVLQIPEGTKRIAGGAAMKAAAEKLILPDSLQSIGEKAFADARLGEIEFGKGLAEVGSSAFSKAHVKKLSLPPNILRVGNDAFEGATIGEVSFSEGLEEIGDSAFCAVMPTDITLPASLMSVGWGNFPKVKSIRLLSNALPEGLLEIARTDGYEDNTGIIIIQAPSQMYAVPGSIFPSGLDKAQELWDIGEQTGRLMEQMALSYDAAVFDTQKDDAALEVAYSCHLPETDALRFVRKNAQRMAKRYVDMEELGCLSKLAALNVLDADALEELIMEAASNGQTAAAAILMEAVKGSHGGAKLSL